MTPEEKLMLLAYALVYKNWQSDKQPYEQRRGYNIGALLVDETNHPVGFELNHVRPNTNVTEHCEVRVIRNYLQNSGKYDLNGFTIYTTIEPCIMCLGMMMMSGIKKNIFGQNDFVFAHAAERLSTDFSKKGGFAPYPRKIITQATTLPFLTKLNNAYTQYRIDTQSQILAKFLCSEGAKEVFIQAQNLFIDQTRNNEATDLGILTFYNET